MSGLSKSNGTVNFWWYQKHGRNKGRKRKKKVGILQCNIDKSSTLGKAIKDDKDKELDVKNKRMAGAGVNADKTVSNQPTVLSKQAKKRKLKREAAKQEKLEKKKRKLCLKEQGTFEKDKELVKTGDKHKQRKKRLKRKHRKKKNNPEGSPSDPLVTNKELTNEELSPEDRSIANNLHSATISEQRKISDFSTFKSEKGSKKQASKKSLKDDASRSGDKTHDTDRVAEIDKNWMALMKKINYKPPKKNQKEEHKKAKLAKTEADLKGQPEIWFDDVDPELLEDSEPAAKSENKTGNPDLVKGETSSTRLTKYIGIDCEMVGTGPKGEDHMLARVSLVNQHGACIYDKFVAPSEAITDYRSSVSGITSEKLKDAEDFATVQKEVYNIIKGRILVGHALQNDLKVLFLAHPRSMLRDTSTYKPFQELCKTKRPSLKKLSRTILDVSVQRWSHDSVEDAQAAMKLFMLHRQAWEKEFVKKRTIKTKKQRKEKMDTR